MDRPNIVFILIDDMGQRDPSCYGSTFHETPNIDSLAQSGMLFTDAYAACPVCSPTRASILTGKYPERVGITNYIDWAGKSHPNTGKLIDAPYLKALPKDEITVAQALRQAGYATWHVGKWHLGGPGHYPDDVGFDLNVGGCEWGLPQNGYFAPWGIPTMAEGDDGTYLTDQFGDEAVRLIEGAGNQPFFLNLWFHSVHTPIQAKQEKIDKYKRKRKRLGLDQIAEFEEGNFYPADHRKHLRIQRRIIQSDPVYAAMIESLDENIGKVISALEHAGKAEQSVVILTSDNGGLSTAAGSPTCNAPLSEGKGWMYEGGTREPFIVSWPGSVTPGTRCSTPISSPDIYPTLLDIAGLPSMPEQHVDGVSFLPALRGDDTFSRGPIYWHFAHYCNQGGTPAASVRDGDWKLIRFFEDGHEELFNLAADVSETENLINEDDARAGALGQLLSTWLDEIGALYPQTNPNYIPWSNREPSGHFADQSQV